MRTTEHIEICISSDKLEVVARVFISNGKKGEESKIAERHTERECVCASVGQNPQQRRSTSTTASGRENTSVAINDSRHL
jgi:hypothetical protein